MPLNFVAKAAITVALTAANMALTMSRKIEGPRLDNLKFTSGDYGAPLPIVWGLRRMEVSIFWAEDLREVKRRRKTKGGKFNEYTYYGTWAVALAGHEIEAVRRIWFDTHLVYDVSGTGPVTPFDFGTSGANIEETIAIYLGTDTQDPDPRMQATVEAEFGEGSCPAYRDTAYIVFKDIPLEKIGNRIPQVSVEIVGAASTIYPSTSLTTPAAGSHLAFNHDYSALLVSERTKSFSVVDVAARATIVGYTVAGTTGEDSQGYALLQDGTVIRVYGGNPNRPIYSTSLANVETLIGFGSDGTVTNATDGDGVEHWLASSGTDDKIVYDGEETDSSVLYGKSVFAIMLCADCDGNIWWMGRTQGDDLSNEAFFNSPTLARHFTTDGLDDVESEPFAFHYADETNDHFVVGWGGKLWRVSRADGTVLGSVTPGYPGGITVSAFRAVVPGASTFWIGFQEYSSADLTLVRSLDHADWQGGTSTYSVGTVYDPVNHALLTMGGGQVIWNYLDRVGSSGVTLQTIADDVAEMCGADDCDFSDLTQTVTGWSATRGQASAMLEPLLDAYDSDIAPHDFGIRGKKRTGVTAGSTLLTERFVGDPRYRVDIRTDLPRAILFDFADVDADQQPNTARADRPLDATGAVGEQKLDLTTLALDADEAIQLANRYFRRLWNERKNVTLSLTAQELKLEPADVRTLSLDGDTFAARCVRTVVKADDTIETEWKYDSTTLATLDGSAGAPFDGRDESTIVVPLLSKGFVLDIPLIEDADEDANPRVYPLAAPFTDGAWPGATVYQSVDGEYSEELATVASSDSVTWGSVAEDMPYANPNLWDRGTEITVTLQTGDLTGCTEAAANADPTLNLAAIGDNGRWELVQFTVATLTAPLTYTVSGFKRGRRGTEWAAELHAAGDSFVLLEAADPISMNLGEVGTDVSFKPITAGRTSGFPFGYTFAGQSLMPYAPVHLEAVKESNGDWTLTWVRRTRIGGAWTSGTPIPLGEATEEYEITVGDGVDADTITVTDPEYTWTLADQTTLTGGEVLAGDLEWSVAQVSDAVGAGFLATA